MASEKTNHILIMAVEGNNIKMKYSSVWRPPMSLYNVHILLPTPHKHLKEDWRSRSRLPHCWKHSEGYVPLAGKAIRSQHWNKSKAGRNEDDDQCKRRRKKPPPPAFSNVTCISVLKSSETTHFKLPVKDRQFLPPTCHLQCPLFIQSTRQTNLTPTPFYPPLLYATHISPYPTTGAVTNKPHSCVLLK